MGCGFLLGSGSDCDICGLYLSDQEARLEDIELMAQYPEPSDLADHYPVGD